MKKILPIFALLIFSYSSFSQKTNPSWLYFSVQPKGNYFEVKSKWEEQYKLFKPLWDKDLSKKVRKEYSVKNHEIRFIEKESGRLDPMLKELKKWEFEIAPFLDKNGNFDKTSLTTNTPIKLNIDSSSKSVSNFGSVSWNPIGMFRSDRDFHVSNTYYEANIGKINSILFDKNDTLTFYIASVSSGVWKTKDGGKNWQFLSQDWELLNVGSIQLVMDPNDSNVIYAIIDNYNYYKSINGGLNWEIKEIFYPNGQKNYQYVNTLLLNKDNPNIMLLVKDFSLNFLKSTDGGSTWNTVGYIPEIGNWDGVESVIAHPTNPNIIYAATIKGRIFKSLDGGENFSFVFQHPDGLADYSMKLAVTIAEPNNLYFSSCLYYSSTHVFKSTDMGSTFSRLTPQNNFWYNQGRYCHVLQVSPTNGNEIWFGLGVMKKTIDNGVNWIDANYSANYNPYKVGVHLDYQALNFQPITNKLFIGTDGGLYRYNGLKNNDMDFSFFAGYNTTEVYRLGSLENEGNQIVFGTQDNGTHLYKNGKFSLIGGGDGMECFFDKENTNSIYYSGQYGNLVNLSMTNPQGVYTSLYTTNVNTQWLCPWKRKNQTMIAAYDKIHVSTDNGLTWTTSLSSPTYCREVEIVNSSTFYAGNESGIYKTIDGGQNWNQISNKYSYRFKTDPSNSQTIYNLGGNIYKSIDGGNSWIDLGRIPNTMPTSIAIDKNNPNDIYIGSYKGVYTYQNNTWVPYNLDLPNVQITDLEINYVDGGKLRAATYGRGIWETNLITPCVPPSAIITYSNGDNNYKILSINYSPNFSYQWLKNGTTLVGETNTNYSTNVPGDYSVIVTQGTCSKLSEVIRICPNLEIVSAPIYGPDANSDFRAAINVQANSEIFLKKVEFNAQNSIILYPGFIINSRDDISTFKASIGGCN